MKRLPGIPDGLCCTFSDGSRCSTDAAHRDRKGAILPALTFLCLIGAVAAVIFVTVVHSPIGEQPRNANGTDLAAIIEKIEGTALSEGKVDASAVTLARQMAAEISQFDDSDFVQQLEVRYGLRTFNAESAEYEIQWGGTPINVVKVVSQGSADDDGSGTIIPVVFTGVFDGDGLLLRAEAIAYMDAPDLVDAVDQ